MVKSFALALMIGGGLLVYFGIRAYRSLGSDISLFLIDSAIDKTIWMLLVGVLLWLGGVAGLLFYPKTS